MISQPQSLQEIDSDMNKRLKEVDPEMFNIIQLESIDLIPSEA